MDEARRAQSLNDAIYRAAEVPSGEVLIGLAVSWALGAGAVFGLTWLLSLPVNEAPVAYAIVFAAVSFTFVFAVAVLYVGQSIADVARGAKAIALSQLPRSTGSAKDC